MKRLEDNPELKSTNIVSSTNLQQEMQDAPIEAANKIKTKMNCIQEVTLTILRNFFVVEKNTSKNPDLNISSNE